MTALVDRGSRLHLKKPRTVVLLGVDLNDAREEAFCRMVCDGLSVGMAYVKAGFTAKGTDLPFRLFRKPHIQERAAAILEARRTQGVITLPEVTDMLKRVFAGALHDAEYSAAHNAAFSLARLYGHVTDRATIEILRRPSRDPDAPSEQALGDWVASLPALNGPGPSPAAERAEGRHLGQMPARPDAPAAPYNHISEPQSQFLNDINAILRPEPQGPYLHTAGLGPSEAELSNEIKGLEASGRLAPGRPENGAPSSPVTEAPTRGGRTAPSGKRVPLKPKRVPVKKREKSGAEKRKARKMKELFG
jgi:hypothetical protein